LHDTLALKEHCAGQLESAASSCKRIANNQRCRCSGSLPSLLPSAHIDTQIVEEYGRCCNLVAIKLNWVTLGERQAAPQCREAATFLRVSITQRCFSACFIYNTSFVYLQRTRSIHAKSWWFTCKLPSKLVPNKGAKQAKEATEAKQIQQGQGRKARHRPKDSKQGKQAKEAKEAKQTQQLLQVCDALLCFLLCQQRVVFVYRLCDTFHGYPCFFDICHAPELL